MKYIFQYKFYSKTAWKSINLKRLCSKFEVDISKKLLSVRFCLGAVPSVSTKVNWFPVHFPCGHFWPQTSDFFFFSITKLADWPILRCHWLILWSVRTVSLRSFNCIIHLTNPFTINLVIVLNTPKHYHEMLNFHPRTWRCASFCVHFVQYTYACEQGRR